MNNLCLLGEDNQDYGPDDYEDNGDYQGNEDSTDNDYEDYEDCQSSAGGKSACFL